MNLYKLLNANGRSCNGGLDQWSLPEDGKPGAWMPSIVDPKLCSRGYHGVPIEYVLDWEGDTLWEMEVRGKKDESPEKTTAEQARLVRQVPEWNDKNLRLFACDCAEHVLPIYLDSSPEDGGMALMLAIHIIREYAHGRADEQDLEAAWAAAEVAAGAAARATAWRAAEVAAEAAAEAAARAAAGAARAAGAAARAAVRAAARAAVRAAAAGAAWAAGAAGAEEKEWQINRLCEYLQIENG